MDVNNKYVFVQDGTDSFQITIPIQSNWDFEGLDDAIDVYEANAIKEVVGEGYSFEIARLPHDKHELTDRTDVNYDFYFYSGGSLDLESNWLNSYLGEGFTTTELYYYANKFKKSFFKLDFYDTVDDKRQKNYLTVILPTQQGETMDSFVQRTPVKIKKPTYKLDYVGDVEGFFMYWLRSLKFLPLNTFYMTAKFYNAGTGQFTKMMNRPQSTVIGNKYNFDVTQYYYYRVVFDYVNQVYRIYNMNGDRVGTTSSIKWYEYVNPPTQ